VGYAFINEYAHEHSVVYICKVLKVSEIGYYRSRSHIVSAQL